MNPVVVALAGLGLLAMLAVVALAIFGLASEPDPWQVRLLPMWMVTILFGALLVRIAFVGARALRGGSMAKIDAEGATNFKDGLGPIEWRHIRGASIEALPYVPRIGSRSALFVDVPDAVAKSLIAKASFMARHSRYPSTGGLTRLPLMEAPPYTVPQLEETLASIRARAGLAK